MAYVRSKGNQVVIVHGTRDPETKKVQQRTLFAFYSKAEAKAALGEQRHWFRHLIEEEHASIRFNWDKIEEGIAEHMEVLPDLYTHRKERVDDRFRAALVDFARELLVADPDVLASNKHVINAYAWELEFIKRLIDWNLGVAAIVEKPSKWQIDDPFFWRTTMMRKTLPPSGMEMIDAAYEEGRLDDVESMARLFLDCWSNYADGHNYLGDVAEERGELEEAIEHYKDGARVGRTLFPKRLPKKNFDLEPDTRPYMRGLIGLAMTYNRLGMFDQALHYCDKLEHECDDKHTAAALRAPIYLNMGHWLQSIDAAKMLVNVEPGMSIIIALASFMLEDDRNALGYLTMAVINNPIATAIIVGNYEEVPKAFHARHDYLYGQGLEESICHFLEDEYSRAVSLIRTELSTSKIRDLIASVDQLKAEVNGGTHTDQETNERLFEMRSRSYAFKKAAELWPEMS